MKNRITTLWEALNDCLGVYTQDEESLAFFWFIDAIVTEHQDVFM